MYWCRRSPRSRLFGIGSRQHQTSGTGPLLSDRVRRPASVTRFVVAFVPVELGAFEHPKVIVRGSQRGWPDDLAFRRMSQMGPGCVKTLERSAAVYKFQSIFGRFPPLQARRSEKVRSRCAVFRQFPSFHTAWVTFGKSEGHRERLLSTLRPTSSLIPRCYL